jgi:hypothetical protein
MSHARLSPSNHRWVHCPGSVEAESVYPDISGDAAIDGTGSHLLLELCIQNKQKAEEFLGRVIGVNHTDKPQGWTVCEQRIERVKMALNYLKRRKRELRAQYPDCKIDVQTEVKVDPGSLFSRDDWYGTSDIVIKVTDDQWRIVLIEVVDYKDGRLFVSAEDNSQLQSYAIGAVRSLCAVGPDGTPIPFRQNWDFNIRMTIVQPKSSTPIRYDDCKLSDLLQAAKKLNIAAKRTDDDEAPLIPDELDGKGWCRWCKHRDNCPALKNQKAGRLKLMGDIQKGGDVMETLTHAIKQIDSLPDEKLIELHELKGQVESIFKQVEIEMQNRIEGPGLPGYAMLPGRMTRVWNDTPEAIEKMLKAKKLRKIDIFETKMRSPAGILKNKRLTPEAKERIEKDFVTERTSTYKVGKVKKQEKSIKSMFGGIPQTPNFL